MQASRYEQVQAKSHPTANPQTHTTFAKVGAGATLVVRPSSQRMKPRKESLRHPSPTLRTSAATQKQPELSMNIQMWHKQVAGSEQITMHRL
jgi:hypothetical protein